MNRLSTKSDHCGRELFRPLKIVLGAPFPPISGGMAELAKLLSRGFEMDGCLVRHVDFGKGLWGICILPWLYLQMAWWSAWSDVVQIISGSGRAMLGKDLPFLLIARMLGRKVVLNFVGGAAVDSIRNWGWLRRLPFRLAHVVVVPTERFRDALLAGELKARFVVIPHVVEVERFNGAELETSKAIPILFAAKGLTDYARMDLLIRSMPAIHEKVPNCELWIAGDGPERGSLETLARNEGTKGIKFLGSVSHDEVPKLMSKATIFLHSTRYESFGLALVEAMAAGLPVVAYSVGGIPNVVLDGHTGYLVADGDFRAFGERVVCLLLNESARKSMSQQARAWSQRFAWSEISRQWTLLHASLKLTENAESKGAQHKIRKEGVLWIGNHVSSTRGTKGVSEHVMQRLRSNGWIVFDSSSYENRVIRLLDMMGATTLNRQRYEMGVIDVYSGNAFRYAEMVVRLLRFFDKPVLLVLHGGALLEFARSNSDRVRSLMEASDRVVTPSIYLKEGLAKFKPDIQYIPNGLDCIHFKFQKREVIAPRLCWVRAFNAIYNPSLAVRCLVSVLKNHPLARLRMIGPDHRDGSFDSAMKIARENGIEYAIELVGPIANDQLPHELAKSDIFLNTTNYESFGVSVLEAAASGLCIVSTNVGEIPRLWKNGHEAILVSPNDSVAMAEAVHRLLTEPELGRRLCQNARLKAEKFDWSKIIPQWEMILSTMCGRD